MKLVPLLFILLLSGTLHAATFKIFAAETPPLLEKKGEGVAGFSGVFGKIVADKVIKSGQASQFEVVWVPWKRALNEATKNRNALFFPIARTNEREKSYTWLAHLGAVESWFYVVNPKVKIHTLEDLKKYRIGFLSGSMREAELKKIMGSDSRKLEGLTEDLGNYRKLISGRIDIWAAQIEVFEKSQAEYKARHKSTPHVFALRKFLDQDVWIVGGAGMDEKHQDQIRAIFKPTKKIEPPAKPVNTSALLSSVSWGAAPEYRKREELY